MKKVLITACILAICAALGYFIGSHSVAQKPIPPDAPYSADMDIEQKIHANEVGRQQIQIMVENKNKRHKGGEIGASLGAAVVILAILGRQALRPRPATP